MELEMPLFQRSICNAFVRYEKASTNPASKLVTTAVAAVAAQFKENWRSKIYTDRQSGQSGPIRSVAKTETPLDALTLRTGRHVLNPTLIR
jgi:hypothetical protein